MTIYEELEKNGIYYHTYDKWDQNDKELDKLIKFVQSIHSLGIKIMNAEYIFVLYGNSENIHLLHDGNLSK